MKIKNALPALVCISALTMTGCYCGPDYYVTAPVAGSPTAGNICPIAGPAPAVVYSPGCYSSGVGYYGGAGYGGYGYGYGYGGGSFGWNNGNTTINNNKTVTISNNGNSPVTATYYGGTATATRTSTYNSGSYSYGGAARSGGGYYGGNRGGMSFTGRR
jgi:hypothetical protein